MSRAPSSRLLATSRVRISSLSRSGCSLQPIRPFSQTSQRQDEPWRPASLLGFTPARSSQSNQPTGPPMPSPSDNNRSTSNQMSALQRLLVNDMIGRARNQRRPAETLLEDEEDKFRPEWGPSSEPFHFHIYSHKHNSHITVTKPNRNAIISMSTGNIGFRKSKRGSYDAAYQLTSFVIDKLHQGNWHKNITAMEVVLRGFGPGREAATKVLLGNEGRMLRDKIIKVSDATRLKFGGTRSKGPRRLG